MLIRRRLSGEWVDAHEPKPGPALQGLGKVSLIGWAAILLAAAERGIHRDEIERTGRVVEVVPVYAEKRGVVTKLDVRVGSYVNPLASIMNVANDAAKTLQAVQFNYTMPEWKVLDKSIEQTSATPLEELEYTVRIYNDGPSTAMNVSFLDELPAGVTYKSYTIDKAGVTLAYSNGKLTGNLPGRVIAANE